MFFLPLFDNNPTLRRPYISWLFLAACIVVFFWQESLAPNVKDQSIFLYGFIPSHFSGIATLNPDFAILPAWMTIFSSMFMHGGWMHIGGNMLYLWIFGDNIEDSMGRTKFILFYCLCGAAAALAQMAINPASQIPMVGASGAIAGILGAYLVLHPRAVIRSFLWILIFIRFVNLPAWLVLGVWIGGQFLAVPNALDSDGGGVAYFAHIGGFVAGVVLIPFFKHKDIPLFGRNDPEPLPWSGKAASLSTLKAEAKQRYHATGSRIPFGSRRVAPHSTPTMRQSAGRSVPGFTKKKSTAKDSGPKKRGPWG